MVVCHEHGNYSPSAKLRYMAMNLR